MLQTMHIQPLISPTEETPAARKTVMEFHYSKSESKYRTHAPISRAVEANYPFPD
jgi:hypothetical protein